MEVLNNYLANSVDLYGGSGSGGGGTTNYDELYNKPLLCNVELAGNIILTQVMNSPDDTIIIGSYSIQVNKQLFYTKTQVDSLVAGISATYITATLPANPSANTYYLVGNNDDGYVLYYYDSNLTEAKVGNYTLDVDEFLKKTDITITIDSSSTNLQVPSAKAVYENTAQSRLYLIGLSGCSTLLDVVKRITKLDTGSTSTFRNYFVNSWVTAFPSALKVPNLDDYGTLQFCGCYRNNSGTENILGELRFRPSGSSVWYRTPINAVDWKPIQVDAFAPISSSYAHANNSVSYLADDCVFNFHYQTNNNRSSETKLFSNVRIIHPISRIGNIFGSLRTTQTLKTSATIIFIQEFTESINGDTGGLLYFRRVGVLENAGWNFIEDNKSNIVWQDWQPVNYNYTKKGHSSSFSLNECLWDVSVDRTDSVISESRILTNVSFTCPITNTTKFYRVETTIDNSGTTASGRSSVITQIATRITDAGTTTSEILKRIGLLSYDATNVSDVSKVYTYRSKIVWKSWYPIEYPATNFTLNSTKATTNTCSYYVSGSSLYIRITGLIYTTSSVNETIGSIPDGFRRVIKGRNPILAGFESNGIVRTMYIDITDGAIKVNVSTDGTALTNTLQVYTPIALGY